MVKVVDRRGRRRLGTEERFGQGEKAGEEGNGGEGVGSDGGHGSGLLRY